MERGDLTGALLDDRYRVLEPVNEGAMGVVYRAERVKLGRIVAIKVLHEVLPNELSARKRFEIEAMAMAKLEHPHCASVLDVGVHGDRPYVVMDFVSGQNLKDLIANGPLPIPRATEIVRQVLSGLAHAHEHGIIHRDIKPANLVLSQKTGLGDHVKVLDFGLARLHDTGQNLTTGVVVGTPAYMAPEQIRGLKLDHRVDLYACGVLLFELLTGKKPFHSESDDPIEVCRMHLSNPIPQLADKLPGVDFGELEAVVAKALAKNRDDRYASAEEYAAALDAAVPRRPSYQVLPALLLEPLGTAPAVPPVPLAPPGASLQLASADVMEIGDVSLPASVELRSADVISAIPAPPAGADAPTMPPAEVVDPRARTVILPEEGDTSARTETPPEGGDVRARAATPPAGVDARARLATPPAGVDARARVATPPAGVDARTRVATPPAGTVDVRTRTATPPAGTAGLSADSSAESESVPGMFLGRVVSPSRVMAPREVSTETPFMTAVEAPAAASPAAAKSSPAPAKSSPAPAKSSSAATKASSAAAKFVRGLPARWRRSIAIVGIALVAGIVSVAVIATRGGTPAPGDAGVASGVASGSTSEPDPSREIVARANDLLAQGDKDAALELLNRARKQYPASAALSYAAGRIYFSKYYWTEGLKSFREALRNDPAYRTDPEFIKTVLRGFIVTPSYNEDLAGFLREDIGSPAQPFLEETARDHPNPAIRSRAASELRRYR